MLKVREATASELGRYYNALKIDFDRREILPLSSVRKAVRRGDQEFLLFYDEETGIAVVEQRNKMDVGDTIEVFGPKGDAFTQKLEYMTDEEGSAITSAPHPQQILQIKMAQPVAEMYMLRKEK